MQLMLLDLEQVVILLVEEDSLLVEVEEAPLVEEVPWGLAKKIILDKKELIMQYDFGSYFINVRIIHKNNKNVYFRVDEDSNLVVTCPKYMQEIDIKNLIKKNETSIKKMIDKASSRYEDDQKFKYLGKLYEIIFVNNIQKVGFKDGKVYTENLEMLEKFITKECLHVFTNEIEICKKCFNDLPNFSLKIRKMKTRWGVCNTRKKQITLNSNLLKYEPWIIDYVIIHEMCHFFEGNHSKDFWDLVAVACPRYKEARKALRE